MLLSAGASANTTDACGFTPLHCACVELSSGESQGDAASRHGGESQGDTASSPEGDTASGQGSTASGHEGDARAKEGERDARVQELDAVVALLLENKADPNAANAGGMTPLMYCGGRTAALMHEGVRAMGMAARQG